MQKPLKKFNLQIHGMTCQNCEVLIERKFKQVPGVVRARANLRTGKAEIIATEVPRLKDFQHALQDEPQYTVTSAGAATPKNSLTTQATPRQNHAETGAIALLVFGLYFFLSQAGVLKGAFSLGVSDSMSYSYVFLIGLVAALSTCMAVTGGLLLTVSAKYAQLYPNLSTTEKAKPHIYFNIGRVLSYTILGGVAGTIGSAFAFSPKATGYLSLAASLFMVLMALNMLKVPGATWLNILRMPKFISHRVHDLSGRPGKSAPFLLGAVTFFLPCGFTQALQIYALSTGSFTRGAATMFAFALGTLPALGALGAVSSFAKGGFARVFPKFVGTFVLILGTLNINNGLALAGSNFSLAGIFRGQPANIASRNALAAGINDPNVIIDGKTQVVRMTVDGFRYVPNHFTIYEGLPVRWLVYGKNTYGCASVLTVPRYGIVKFIQQGVENEITFVPTEVGELRFTCSMGMYSGTFTVVPRPPGVQAPQNTAYAVQTAPESNTPSCIPGTPGCNIQVVNMTIGNDGYVPQNIVVKKDVPVELIIDDQIPLGGCMGTTVIPEYGLAKLLKQGQNRIAFNPTRAGTFPITCSMGGRMAELTVVD